LPQRLLIHVRQHQHVAGGGVLRDDGHEALLVEFDFLEKRGQGRCEISAGSDGKMDQRRLTTA
jgi:hypothetical protein